MAVPASRRVPALGGGLALASPSLRPSSSISPAEPFALPFASTPVCVYAAPTRIPHSLGEGAWFACCVVLGAAGSSLCFYFKDPLVNEEAWDFQCYDRKHPHSKNQRGLVLLLTNFTQGEVGGNYRPYIDAGPGSTPGSLAKHLARYESSLSHIRGRQKSTRVQERREASAVVLSSGVAP